MEAHFFVSFRCPDDTGFACIHAIIIIIIIYMYICKPHHNDNIIIIGKLTIIILQYQCTTYFACYYMIHLPTMQNTANMNSMSQKKQCSP